MDEPANSAPPAFEPAPPLNLGGPPEPSALSNAFMGPNGIRAGWRLLIYAAIIAAMAAGGGALAALMGHPSSRVRNFTAHGLLVGEGISFFICLLASWIMTKIEGRKLGDYGLPARGMFGARFWQGMLIGFASITALLVAMRAAHVFYFGPVALHGTGAWKYGLLWLVSFLFVGFFEEYFFRGYGLFTLTTGVGFWPAAIILSAIFGGLHRGNAGESWVGAFSAGAIGLVFCLMLRRTGDLWLPVGFHAAWDWGETYFYGVPDSGFASPQHLFTASFHGPQWLTGGSVGPEGSWLCLALTLILAVIFAVWGREAKYPNPAAIPDPRNRK